MSNIASVEGALQALQYHKINKSFIPDENVFDFVIEALEEFQQLKKKATAKKPKKVARYGIFDCPHCNRVLFASDGHKYCPRCGGLLDWSEGRE